MSRASIIVLLSAVVLLLLVLELVRSRRLKEEYAWLWLLSTAAYLLVSIRSSLGSWINRLFGAQDGSSVFVFMGLYFLVIISIQYSIRLSRLTTQNKDLAQQVAILDSELRRLSQNADADGAGGRVGEQEALELKIAALEERFQELTGRAAGSEPARWTVEEGARAERVDR